MFQYRWVSALKLRKRKLRLTVAIACTKLHLILTWKLLTVETKLSEQMRILMRKLTQFGAIETKISIIMCICVKNDKNIIFADISVKDRTHKSSRLIIQCHILFDLLFWIMNIVFESAVFKQMGRYIALQFIIMWDLSNKLHKIRSDLRKEQLTSMMRRTRNELQRQNDQAILNDLISLPQGHFGEIQLQTLVEYANKDFTLALAHLGNLAIDRFLTAQVLSGLEWQLGSNQKWTWMINAFAEIGFCTNEMLEYCVKRVITKKSNFNLENALEVLTKAFKLGPACLDYFRQPELVLALANHAYDSSDRISLLVFTLLTTASSEDENVPRCIYQSLGEARLVKMLLHGLMKIQTVHRAYSVQIANNFLLSGIQLEAVLGRILELAVTEKERVKLEISYYLKALADIATQKLILFLIKHNKLQQILQAYVRINSSNPKYDQQISLNASQSQTVILQRFSRESSGDKMMDQSDVQTLYEDESSRIMAD